MIPRIVQWEAFPMENNVIYLTHPIYVLETVCPWDISIYLIGCYIYYKVFWNGFPELFEYTVIFMVAKNYILPSKEPRKI